MDNRLLFPDKLEIHLIEDGTNKPVSKIALLVTIYARAKNDYHLGPPPSDEHGKIIIDRNWVRDAIKYQKDSFLMDYQTSMEDCWPDIRLKVMSQDEINRAIAAMELYGIEEGDPTVARTVSDMRNASNKIYKPVESNIKLENNNERLRIVELKIQRQE